MPGVSGKQTNERPANAVMKTRADVAQSKQDTQSSKPITPQAFSYSMNSQQAGQLKEMTPARMEPPAKNAQKFDQDSSEEEMPGVQHQIVYKPAVANSKVGFVNYNSSAATTPQMDFFGNKIEKPKKQAPPNQITLGYMNDEEL